MSNNKKNITVKHFKEIVKPTLTQRPIYIRKDEMSDDNTDKTTDEEVAIKVSQMLPLIRVGDYVIHRADISYFSLTVGKSLFPKITFTFNDEKYKCRSTLTSKHDFITVYFGNVVDEYFVKQEYVLNDISSNPGIPDITLSGYLYVPKLYEINCRYFNTDNDADTSFKIVKRLCEECNLGMISNLDTTNDSQTWIQDNCTNIDFLESVLKHAYTGNDTKIVVFIDQYDYLNFIDLKKAYENRELEKTSKHPLYGRDLEETKDIILTSSRYDNENYPFQIGTWTNNTVYGSNLVRLPEKIKRFEYDITTIPFKVDDAETSTNTKLIPQSIYTEFKTDAVHANYKNIRAERRYIDLHYTQGDTINVEMAYPVMVLYPYMYVPVNLFYYTIKPDYDDQNSDKTVYELGAEIPKRNEEAETKDELHSGDYIILSIRYEISHTGENTQFLELQRLPKE